MAQRGLVTTLVLLVPLTFFAQSPPQRLDINGARVLAHLEALSSFGRTSGLPGSPRTTRTLQ